MDEYDSGYSITKFLESFEGLEDLFLSTYSDSTTLDIWRSALRHKETLKRFIHHHHRSIDLDKESPLFQENCDVPDLSFYLEHVADFPAEPSQNPSSALELTSIGLCLTPEFMVGRRDLTEIA
jgi:hypothetical protein